jgi:hypothetical protein
MKLLIFSAVIVFLLFKMNRILALLNGVLSMDTTVRVYFLTPQYGTETPLNK